MSEVEQWSKVLRQKARTDSEFVTLVNDFVNRRIRYDLRPGWDVVSAERTIQERRGDCSEIALLKVELLKLGGIDARYVWGYYVDGRLHAQCEVHLDHYVFIIDKAERGTFLKVGDGLHPKERMIP